MDRFESSCKKIGLLFTKRALVGHTRLPVVDRQVFRMYVFDLLGFKDMKIKKSFVMTQPLDQLFDHPCRICAIVL